MTNLGKTMPSFPPDDGTCDDDGHESDLADAEKNIVAHPNDPTGYIKRGRLLDDDGNYEKAMDNFNKAIQLDPDNAEAHAARGLLFSSYFFDDSDRARGDFDTAMNILSRNYPVRLQRREGDAKSPTELAEVIKLATKDIRNKRKPYAALIRRARAYHDLVEPLKMERDLAKAIEREPQNAEAFLLRAELRTIEEDDKRVKADVEEANRLDPTRPEGFTALANLYCHAGADLKDLALEAVDKALGINADFAPAHFVRGEILREMGKLPDAINEFRTALTLDPADAWAHRALAECLEATGVIPEAIAEYREFIANADRVHALDIIDAIKDVDELKSVLK
jgi:tetratricopeptide (TPR) repeat protein